MPIPSLNIKRGYKNEELSMQITTDCAILLYQYMYNVLDNFYHVDTYEDKTRWRIQGYIYCKDIVSLKNVAVPECEISMIDGEYILFITKSIPKV